jgi:uncharacterized protein (TIGR03382 family)
MSPTGSTSEQKSPTKWQLRLGLVLMLGLLLLMATTASAGWSTRTAPGTPIEVRVWAPGVFSVATDAGAWLTRADGTTAFINTVGDAVASHHTPGTTCFAAIQSDGTGRGNAPCDRNLTLDLARVVRRVRSTDAGVSFALLEARDNLNISQLYWTSDLGSIPWSLRAGDILGLPSRGLSVLSMGGAGSEDVLLGTLRFGPGTENKLHWYRGNIKMAEYGVPDAGSPPVVRDMEVIDLFPAGGSTPTALVGWGNSLFRGTLGDGGSPFSGVPYPGGEGSVTALDVNTGAGAQYGDGFGMATVQRDGGVTLLRAVPSARPEDIGTQWRVSSPPDGGLIAPRSLECHGASFCVIAQATSSGNNVFVYSNDAPPTLTASSDSPDPFTLPSGMSRTINVRASDADEDAVLVKVEPSSFSRDGVSMTTTAVNGGVDLMLNAGTICSAFSQPIRVTATDGLDSHLTGEDYLLQVQRAAGPEAPTLSPGGNITVTAGSRSLTIRATSPNAPCGLGEFSWTPVSPDTGRLVVSGPKKEQADFFPPATLCNRFGETHLYRVRAVDDGGVSSPPTDVNIQVLPWGPPHAPFDGGTSVVLLAGDVSRGATELRPNATHACDVLGNGFPGVDTVWRLVGRASAPPGVRLRAGRDGPPIGSSAVTPVLYIETDECTDTTFNLAAQHYTLGGFGDGGPESNITVTVDKNWNPLSEATLRLEALSATPSSVVGRTRVEDLRCLAERGDLGLRARISLTNDGGIVREGIFDVPGAWQFTLGNVCEGATFELKGELLVDGGVGGGALPGGEQRLRGPFAVVTGAPIIVPSVEQAMLQPMAAPSLTARCGQPAMGVLEQRALQPCSELPISWMQVGGPELTQPAYTGQRIEVATRDTDFGELIGQSVAMSMSATVTSASGTQTTTELKQEIPILTEPFVELNRRTEKATGADVDLVGVSVELRNTTECGVSQVDHQERLEGADYVPGSARFNGAPVEAEVEGDTLTVRGLVLEGSTTGRLTYVVRPRLLESSRFEGQAFVRGVPVSQPLEDPSTGCGCSGAGSGVAALGLAGLAVVLRRRRRQ